MDYWIAVNGRRSGPYSLADFQRMARDRQVPPTTLVWEPGEERWMPMQELLSPRAPTPVEVNATPPSGWPPPGWSPPSGPVAPAQYPGGWTAPPSMLPPYSALALTSFVMALVSIPLAFVLVGIGFAIAAIVLGHLGLRDVRRSEQEGIPRRGRGFAIAGLSIGYASAAFCLLLIIAITIPVALNPNPSSTSRPGFSQPAGSDAAVQTDLRNAAMAEETFMTDTGKYTESLSQLRQEGFSPRSGADFVISATGSTGYCVSAFRSGLTTYHYESDGAIAQGPCPEQLL